MSGWTKILLLLFFISFPFAFFGQAKKQLENKRKSLLYDIKNTNKILNQTSKNKEQAYERLLAVQVQIKNREALIQTIQEEMEIYEQSIFRSTEVIQSLEQDAIKVKEDYEEMLRMAYRRKLMKSDLAFIFSATNFNKAYKRWQYIKQYDKYRKKQAQRIIATQESLKKKLEQLEYKKEEKTELFISEQNQLVLLNDELKSKKSLYKKLKSNEKKLRNKILQQKKEHESLNKAIEQLIETEIIAQRKRNRTYNPSSSDTNQNSSSFKNLKGTLPLPVENGVISSRFGKQAHPYLPDITIDNSGIDILCQNNANVYPVANGEVAIIKFMPGTDYLVIIQHGEYYTLYSKLENINIKKGEKVNANTIIGNVRKDKKTGKSEMHFEIWKNQTRLNPSYWLKK